MKLKYNFIMAVLQETHTQKNHQSETKLHT